MRDTNRLQLALGLTPPWTVTRSDFDPEAQRLDIEIDFAPGSRFPCPHCGAADCPAYDTQRMSWRHLNFFRNCPGWPHSSVTELTVWNVAVRRVGGRECI